MADRFLPNDAATAAEFGSTATEIAPHDVPVLPAHEHPEPPSAPPMPGMVWIPGATYVMGSDLHYPEERPAHAVTVDGFWIDKYPVTNDRFARFVQATGHVTFAEIAPSAEDYPGALPELLHPGSLVFVKPPHPVDLGHIANWWTFMLGADWKHPQGPDSSIDDLALQIGRAHV